MKTYNLWCSLMRGKCYRNIPGAKCCNGKSTTDLKTKILFADVENISKLLCYYSMDDHSRFLFGWPLEEVETCPYLKKLNPFVVIYRHCLSKYLIPRPLLQRSTELKLQCSDSIHKIQVSINLHQNVSSNILS